jgi:choline-sulfatase
MQHTSTIKILILFFGLSIGRGVAAQPVERPNFLFLITDDQTYESIHALNNPEIQTPNMDRLVSMGATFTHCFNQGSWSGAVCVASRTMLITGQTVFRAPKNTKYLMKWASEDLPETEQQEVPLWSEVFTNAGYATFLTGKWHNTDYAALKGFTYAKSIGAGMYETLDPSGSREPGYHRGALTDSEWRPWDPKFTGHWRPAVKDIVYEGGEKKIGEKHTVDKHTSELYADNAIAFLRGHTATSDKPFFMYVAFNAPHDPRQSPREFVEMYPREKMKIPPNYLPEHPFDQGDHKIRDEILAPFPRTQEAVQLHRQEYYAIISHFDRELGRILDALKSSGKADNTYIILTSDHGLAVGMHGLMGKQNQYDHSVRMPFIVAGPGVEPGRQVDNLFYMQSIYATSCDLAGLPVPATVEFPSIAPLLKGKKRGGEKYIFGSYLDLQRMIRSERYKLIVYPKVNEVQLFDLQADPYETNDLAEDPKYKRIVKKMWKELRKKQAELEDELILSEK